ncbi:hypothetical protein [Ancylobacter oerskovii]|uniref:Protamine-2 (Modular protein) n=1 Tax=Ancylobacter oerskovii TaxID=459519 RepID=A0ABW4YUG1_9HYPH|nr:hypothetical protein [Ancylobacter oerskovii]MBS7543635.1 hypothetical protein [Ancylobacter oerskovii]
MDRRGFLLGLAGAIGAGATAGLAFAAPAEATPLDQLKGLAPPDPAAAATPDGTAIEDAQYWGPPRHGWGPPPGPPPGYWRRRRRWRGRRRRVCGWRRDRWGRPFRNCWYVWR